MTLEITETSLMADPVRARRVADELAAIGVRLSIDDFGTGYSSLGHLTALPLSELKIDRSCVFRMAHSPNDMTIVRTILDLGARLDLSVVAEGIESRATRKLVSGLGCTLAQGYELGIPVSAEALTKLLPGRLAASSALVPATVTRIADHVTARGESGRPARRSRGTSRVAVNHVPTGSPHA